MKRKKGDRSVDQAFEDLIKKEEALMNQPHPKPKSNPIGDGFVEDTFELNSETRQESYLEEYINKHGVLSKVLTAIIYVLIAVIIYQVVSLVSMYIGFPFI